tara:strand:- start:1768 stop:2112 length:345 start_codon:yes stop_codon:yes gene_type:complete
LDRLTNSLDNDILRVLTDPLFLYIKIKTMEITIYTNEGCIWCARTKELFARADVEYTEVKWNELSVESQVRLKQEFGSRLSAFPVVIIDKEYIGGLIDTAKLFLKKGLVTSSKG